MKWQAKACSLGFHTPVKTLQLSISSAIGSEEPSAFMEMALISSFGKGCCKVQHREAIRGQLGHTRFFAGFFEAQITERTVAFFIQAEGARLAGCVAFASLELTAGRIASSSNVCIQDSIMYLKLVTTQSPSLTLL
jgi:hypothetical protein